ncbi:MAG: glycerol-3-phosphate acyltransferase [Chloroflexi bacterium]|nr:glycerol-3-phosphate acyltransferase [Chloroflexota bacterium]
MIVSSALAIIVAYFLGAFPTGYVLAKWLKGVDIREVGGRYTGAKNVFQEVGIAAGVATAVGDVAKGALAMLLARALLVPDAVVVLVAVAVIAGHIWPAFLQFRGGAGFATALGVLLAALPREAAIILIPFVLLELTLGRKWGLGPTAALLLIPMLFLSWWLGEPLHLIVLPVVVGALVAARVYWVQIRKIIDDGVRGAKSH